MKKLMLILMLAVLACTAYGCEKQRPDSPAEGMLWDNHGEMEFYDGSEWVALSETKPEIVAGQVWKSATGTWDILEVGEKYIVYTYASETYKPLFVKAIKGFHDDHELVEDVKPITILVDAEDEDDGLIWITTEGPTGPPKPYLHKNPNNDHWICSKHGDLQENWGSSVMTVTPDDDDDGVTYCQTCVYRLLVDQLNQHITGVKE